jgi:hypothetical protein
MLGLLPDRPDVVLLNQISPWWRILHYFMQATTVLLLELSFRTQHVPEKVVSISQMTKKAIEWLHNMSRTSTAAHIGRGSFVTTSCVASRPRLGSMSTISLMASLSQGWLLTRQTRWWTAPPPLRLSRVTVII